MPQFSVSVRKSSIVILQFGFRIGFSSPNVTCWSPAELFKKVFPFYFVKNRSEPFRKVLSRWKIFNNLRHRKNKFEFHEFWNSHQHLERVKKKSSLCRRSEVALSGGPSFRFEFWIFSRFFLIFKIRRYSGVTREIGSPELGHQPQLFSLRAGRKFVETSHTDSYPLGLHSLFERFPSELR